MSRLADFFQGSETTLGVFYPNHYLVAVFGDVQMAENTAQKVRLAGFGKDEVIAAGGQEVVDLSKQENGLGSFVVQALSRFFATEQKYTDHDLEHAQDGAGFLVAHCPTDEIKQKAWGVIKLEAPLDARYYSGGGIEHLAGDFDTD